MNWTERTARDEYQAIKKAYDACVCGDVPDVPDGILALLEMAGWQLVKKETVK